MNLGGVKLPKLVGILAGSRPRGQGTRARGATRRAPARRGLFGRTRSTLAAIVRRDLERTGGNPLPAALSVGSALSGLVKIPGLRRFDPKKHAIRLARLNSMGEQALAGDRKAIGALTLVAQGAPGAPVATYAETMQHAAALLEHIESESARKEAFEAESKAERRAAGAAAREREARFLEAGTGIGSAIAQAALGRGRRPQRRRKRRRSSY